MDFQDYTSTEEWRDIPGYEGRYQASNHGRIRSDLYPTSTGRRHDREHLHILKPSVRKRDGYCHVTLIAPDGERKSAYVHDLVLLTYVGRRPDRLECRHFDGNPSNNRLDNLLYGTAQQNGQDRVRHGTSTRGLSHNTTKLTLEQAREVKRRIALGESDSSIAKDFPIGRTGVYSIRRGTAWGWLDLNGDNSDGRHT